MGKKDKRIAHLQKQVSKLRHALPNAAEKAVKNALDERTLANPVGFATIMPQEDDE